jgi:hypothetical protein
VDVIGLRPVDRDLLVQIEGEVLLAVLQQRLLHVAAAQRREGGRGVDLRVLRASGKEARQGDRANDHQDDPHEWPAEDTTGTFHAMSDA